MSAANPKEDKDAALARIKMLWQEAETMSMPVGTPPDDVKSAIMGRIDTLMNEAEKLDHERSADPADLPSGKLGAEADITIPQGAFEPDLPSEEDIIDELAARVNTAALASPEAPEAEDFASVKSRMEAISRIRPSHQDNSLPHSPEYAFGDAFSTLIRHVVRQYIDDEFEDVMRGAIKSELTRLNWEVDDTVKKTSPKKRAK